jgi:hypothetical protein
MPRERRDTYERINNVKAPMKLDRDSHFFVGYRMTCSCSSPSLRATMAIAGSLSLKFIG